MLMLCSLGKTIFLFYGFLCSCLYIIQCLNREKIARVYNIPHVEIALTQCDTRTTNEPHRQITNMVIKWVFVETTCCVQNKIKWNANETIWFSHRKYKKKKTRTGKQNINEKVQEKKKQTIECWQNIMLNEHWTQTDDRLCWLKQRMP